MGSTDKLDGQPSFLELGRQFPSFGGFFFDDNHNVVLYLTNPGASAAVEERIRELIQGRLSHSREFEGRIPSFLVRPASFSFIQLAQYRTALRGAILGSPAVVTLDVDETQDRVRIGVLTQDAQERIRSIVGEMKIPAAAVEVHITGPSGATTLTVDSMQPDGHIQGGWNANGCTIGFPAVEMDGDSVFTTASHCTSITYGDDDTQFEQPDVSFNWIGQEHYDRAGLCGGTCRYSDATLIGASVPMDLGEIARTTYSGTGDSYGSLIIDTSNPFFTVSGKGADVFVGETLHKVGNTSGWTYGDVLDTCVDVTNAPDGYTRWCSDKVDMASWPGDSGSPVFSMNADSTVDLRGIVWGYHEAFSGGHDLWMSNMSMIQTDLGALVVYQTPPVTAGIDGPTDVPAQGFCTWYADVTPGMPAFTYEWYREDTLVSTSGHYTANVGSSDFHLDLDVTDSRGDLTSDHILFHVGSGSSCPV